MSLYDGALLFADIVLLWLGMGLLVPSGTLLVECLAALRGAPKSEAKHPAAPPFAVLIPAHNERLHLADTLAPILAQLRPEDRVLVVADNCSDDTAAIAQLAGADVLERHDTENRGKGHALAAGIGQLSKLEVVPSVVLLLDADVPPPANSLQHLASVAAGTNRPVQAIYLLEAPEGAGTRAVISELAFLVKNHVRPLGLHRMGFPVPLTGTGIALPWSTLKDVSLASADLVEDMKLGLDLLSAGHPPLLCPEVIIRGPLPDSSKVAHTQRTRWEHGHLFVIRRYLLKLVMQTAKTQDVETLAAALDLTVPPLALLSTLLILNLIATGAYGVTLHHYTPFFLALAAGICLNLSILIAYFRFGSHLSITRIAAAPLYILWKLPMYARFFIGKRQTAWTRTTRT